MAGWSQWKPRKVSNTLLHLNNMADGTQLLSVAPLNSTSNTPPGAGFGPHAKFRLGGTLKKGTSANATAACRNRPAACTMTPWAVSYSIRSLFCIEASERPPCHQGAVSNLRGQNSVRFNYASTTSAWLSYLLPVALEYRCRSSPGRPGRSQFPANCLPDKFAVNGRIILLNQPCVHGDITPQLTGLSQDLGLRKVWGLVFSIDALGRARVHARPPPLRTARLDGQD
jgi:hypothetical protein